MNLKIFFLRTLILLSFISPCFCDDFQTFNATEKDSSSSSSSNSPLADTTQYTLVITLGIAFLVLGIIGAIITLYYWNQNPPPTHKHEKPRPLIVRIILIFFEDLFIEIIGVIFFVYEVFSLRSPLNEWKLSNGLILEMVPITVAFYVLAGLKFALLIFEVLAEHLKFLKELDEEITIKCYKLGMRSDWNSLLAAIIFIPTVVVDGMLLNAERLTPVGDSNFFNGDQIVLCVIDTLLWIKLCVRLILNIHSNKGMPPYHVSGFLFDLINFLFTLVLLLLLILVHLDSITVTGMKVTNTMVIVLVSALTHTYICSYTSMTAHGILALDRALTGSKARIKQLELFVGYFKHEILPVFFTLGFFAYTGWLYGSLWFISFSVASHIQNPGALQGAIYTVVIVLDLFLAFYCWNWFVALTRRFGGYFGWKRPLPDCTPYADSINAILFQCSAPFRMNNRGLIR